MEMKIDLLGGMRVAATFHGFTVNTDQPVSNGGENTAPSPFELFLSSIGTCAGFYVARFCQQRGLPTEGICILQNIQHSPETGLVETITLDIQVPPGFPEKYLPALIRTAELCTVKKHLEHPPAIHVQTVVAEY